MKTCTRCNELKADTEFAWKKKSSNKRHAHCRSCQNIASQEWYEQNARRHVKNVKNNTLRYRKRNRDIIWDYLLVHPCVECGETDPIILEFDHRDPECKSCNVYEFVNASVKKLEQEMAKCDIRCANCHRRKTALQLGWWSDRSPCSSVG